MGNSQPPSLPLNSPLSVEKSQLSSIPHSVPQNTNSKSTNREHNQDSKKRFSDSLFTDEGCNIAEQETSSHLQQKMNRINGFRNSLVASKNLMQMSYSSVLGNLVLADKQNEQTANIRQGNQEKNIIAHGDTRTSKKTHRRSTEQVLQNRERKLTRQSSRASKQNNCYQGQGEAVHYSCEKLVVKGEQGQGRKHFELVQVDPMKFVIMKTTPILDDYFLLQDIGSGSFGQVFKAQLKTTGEIRAVKQIDKQRLDQSEKMFIKNEFQLLKRLDHPNIIKLYDIYDDTDDLYVVTQLCQGGNLLGLVNSQVAMNDQILRVVMQQVFSAIKYMHSFNIVHRDLKLENIMLVEKYSYKKPNHLDLKIIDFGTALDLQKTENRTAQVMGTPIYMPPQALSSNGYNDLPWDIWSLGIMMYIMCTKKLPYVYTDQDHLFKLIKRGSFNLEKIGNVSVELKELIMEMLKKDRRQRLKAADIFDNEWLKKQAEAKVLAPRTRQKTMMHMQKYDVKNNFISIIQSFLVNRKVCQEERQKIAAIFSTIDTDHSGFIEINQLKGLWQLNSASYSQSEVQEIFKTIDKNKSGKIDFNQFITSMYNRQELFNQKHLEQAFDFVDQDQNGWISITQIRDFLNGAENEEILRIFSDIDKDHNEKISKEEFVSYLAVFST